MHLRWWWLPAVVSAAAIMTLAGCSGRKTESNPARLLGQTLVLPQEEWQWRIGGRDTTMTVPGGMKILVYFDAQGCTSCRLKQLGSWQVLIKEVERMKRDGAFEAELVFVFESEPDNPVFLEKIEQYGIDLPVVYDRRGAFGRRNTLPKDNTYHVFLLNANNQVLLVGAPIFSPKLWDRYKTKIREQGGHAM